MYVAVEFLFLLSIMHAFINACFHHVAATFQGGLKVSVTKIFVKMSSKRNQMEFTAEQSLSPKKRMSQGLESAKKGKRKPENDNDFSNLKSPKKAIMAPTRSSRRIKDLELAKTESDEDEIEVVPVEVQKKKRVMKKSSKDATLEGSEEDEIEVALVEVPKKQCVIKNSLKDAIIEG